jgi:hypothetical protein
MAVAYKGGVQNLSRAVGIRRAGPLDLRHAVFVYP